MNNVSQIVQKVRQAPWRVQRQWVGLFLLGLVLVAMVAGIYLNITVRATVAGREIQMLQSNIFNDVPDITDNRRTNADLETQLAGLSSVESMQQRAEALGFQPASPDEMTYVIVPGYTSRKAVDMSTPGSNQPQPSLILPEYTESLLDWITHRLASSVTTGAQP